MDWGSLKNEYYRAIIKYPSNNIPSVLHIVRYVEDSVYAELTYTCREAVSDRR